MVPLLSLLLSAVATPAPAAFEQIAAPAGGLVGFAALDLASRRALGWPSLL
jgi:hypothetical protein